MDYKNSIKIYVVCHKDVYIPEEKNLYPIQVGAALASKRLNNMLYDDGGKDTISELNKDYCELTAIYWAWKNDYSEYVGLFHYRRFLALKADGLKKQLDWWKHYYKETALTDRFIQSIGFDGSEDSFIRSYDLIIPMCSDLKYRNIQSYYQLFVGYRKELDYTIDILLKKYPSFSEAVEICKAGDKGYHCNMFIMKRALFEKYCEWLFSILNLVYSDIKEQKLKTNKNRLIGYLAEFLTGIYIVKMREEGHKMKEVPAVQFQYTDGKKHRAKDIANRSWNSIYRALIPMGTKRELQMYKIIDSIRRINN